MATKPARGRPKSRAASTETINYGEHSRSRSNRPSREASAASLAPTEVYPETNKQPSLPSPTQKRFIKHRRKAASTRTTSEPLRPLFCPLKDLSCHQRRCHPKADRKAVLWVLSQVQRRSQAQKARLLILATVCHKKKLRQEHQRTHEQQRGQRAQKKPKRALQIKGQQNKWLSSEWISQNASWITSNAP